MLLVSMVKWLHFVRCVVLQPPGILATTDPALSVLDAADAHDAPDPRPKCKCRRRLSVAATSQPALSVFPKNKDWGAFGPRQRLNVGQVPFDLFNAFGPGSE